MIQEILRTVVAINYSISYTTRNAREGEANGEDYYFISREEFLNFVSSGEMLEHAEVHGNYYGTSKSRVQRFLDSGNDVILEIDVQGAKSVMDRVPDAVSIFVMPPSFEALTYRLTTRATESPEELSLRLKNSFAEVMRYADFEYVILNDEVTAASRRLSSIILAERQKRVRQTDAIQDILNSFDASKHQGVGDLTNYGQQKRRNN